MSEIGSTTVLLIDDESEVADLLKQMLMDGGCMAMIANSGRDGVDLYKAVPPDVVITDLKMPDMDGVEVIRRLKKIFPMCGSVVWSRDRTEVPLLTRVARSPTDRGTRA